MARRKSRTYKITNSCGIENLGSGGNWNSFLKINRAQMAGQGAGTIHKVRISYIADDEVANATQAGICFVASTSDTLTNTDTAQGENDKYIMASTAGRYNGGVVTLDLNNYKVRDSEENISEKDGPIWLFARMTDLGSTDDSTFFIIAETHGRWLDTATINP
jgi:hypothetical protein